jgi:hypothetical protein
MKVETSLTKTCGIENMEFYEEQLELSGYIKYVEIF